MGTSGRELRGECGPDRAAWRGHTRWAALGLAGLTLGLALAAGPGRHAAATPDAAGPALRAAVEAWQEGELALADEQLRGVSVRYPLVADHADLLRMRIAIESGDFERARGFEASWSGRESPLLGRFYTLLGQAHQELGDEVRARAAWEAARAVTSGRSELAALALAAAESYLRDGLRERAAERLLEVWTRYADKPEARDAGRHLDDLAPGMPGLRSAESWLERADTLYRHYHNEDALVAYERAHELGLGSRDRGRAAHQRAETLFRLRRYPEAVEAFDALPPSDGRKIQRARAVARAGRVEAGALALEKLGTSKRGSQAVRAVYLAGLLWDGIDDDRAGALFEQVIRRAPASSYARSSRWWLGWHAYRAERLQEAERHFADLARRESDPVSALRSRYWLARVREKSGAADAQPRYAEIAGEFPLSYYGWRALERLAEPLTPRPPPVVRAGRRALRPEQLARPRILLEAGLDEEAGGELRRLFDRARGLDDRIALAELYADAGAFDRAQRLVVNAYSETLSRGPSPQHLELWWHAWPAPYPHALAAAAREGGPSEALVYSIMREESGYRPEVISVSGARGLLQLMPQTATQVAESLGKEAFDPDQLFRPEVNIELGSAYLAQLLARFEGHRPAAIGSYNAGPVAVARWLVEPRRPDDEWVEQIPYGQTRAYVKRVLRSLHVYEVLY